MLHRILTATVLALVVLPAFAHDDHIGPNGGYVKHVGSAELELVTDGAKVVVHVRDEKTGKPVTLDRSATGRAIVLVGGKTETVPLAAVGATLQGVAKQPVPAAAKVALALKIPAREDIPSTTFDLGRKAELPRGKPD